ILPPKPRRPSYSGLRNGSPKVPWKEKRMRKLLLAATAIVPLALLAPTSLLAQSGAALTGQVTSAEEGAMEGVVVSAKKEGSTMTISVVSDDKGNFSFPTSKLDPGKYTIAIRAIGYDLQGPRTLEVAGQPAKAEVKLVKTRNLARQMSNGEWIMSVPGTEQQKL